MGKSPQILSSNIFTIYNNKILYFRITCHHNNPILSREEGMSADVTDVGAGCGGRTGAQASASRAYGEIVWS